MAARIKLWTWYELTLPRSQQGKENLAVFWTNFHFKPSWKVKYAEELKDTLGSDALCFSLTILSSGLVFIGIHFLMLRLHFDDPLDAVAVHVGGGSVGIFFVHIFAYEKGILWMVSFGLDIPHST